MKKPYIYLDWNCMKHIKNNPTSDFSQIINILKTTNSYLIPYSFAHLSDLQKNSTDSTLHYIQSDLEFIKTLTSSCMVGMFKDDYDLSIQNIESMFAEVSKYNKKNYNDENTDLENINADNFEEIFIAAFDRFNANSYAYKFFRKVISETHSSCNELQFFNNLSNNQLSKESFRASVDNFLDLEGSCEKTLSSRITRGYLLLEFNSKFKEEITKKTNFSNIYSDSEHMKFACNSNYYVTEDEDTIAKTQFVYKAYGLNVPVTNIKDFINSYDILKKKN